jgi:uncharacterized protein
LKPFTIYQQICNLYPGQQERLVELILSVIKPDRVFLLGASLYRRRSESVFCTCAPSSRQVSDYFLLVLISKVMDNNISEIQDKIEQRCNTFLASTILVLPTERFIAWLKTSHRFAWTVHKTSVLLFDKGDIIFPEPGELNPENENKTNGKCLTQVLCNIREFLVGVDLFRVRGQNRMASFMLHQAIEQGLHAILKIGTGYHCCTHNIDRLLRYGSLVSYRLPDVFPRKTDKDKHLFSLLQKAYINTRYKEDYFIHNDELTILIGKAITIQGLLEEVGKEYIKIN